MTTPADRVAAHNAGGHHVRRDESCRLCADLPPACPGRWARDLVCQLPKGHEGRHRHGFAAWSDPKLRPEGTDE